GRRCGGQARCAVHEPEQRASPERPVQRPLPDPSESFPEPEADLVPAATNTRTPPLAVTRPEALTSPGNVTAPLVILTGKLQVSQAPCCVTMERLQRPS